ncbi:hypothetical protein Cgig2_010833 [Carnegiea gigantea]|uniref:Uncharacterized protein n=1 Tax=Carnegiea gigantea TaxID=171969 RepID=A0A9Q1JT59_9CARY|nr:hypothetical protein Cgig2_010833 [Carnegiea gigantea]
MPWALVTRCQKVGELGIPAMKDRNRASLDKLGWRMIIEPTRVWARVLAYKYCGGGKLLHQARPPITPRHSHLWKWITEQWLLVKNNVAMVLGDGRKTRFSLDQWAERSPLLIFATQYVSAAELEKWVHEYWDDKGHHSRGARDIEGGKLVMAVEGESAATNPEHPFALKSNNDTAETLIHWEAPPAGWALLNTDEAAKGNPGVAAGGGGHYGVIRKSGLKALQRTLGSVHGSRRSSKRCSIA